MGCKPAACGDGFLQVGTELCDDGNLLPNDGCSPTCKLDTVVIATVVNAAKAIPDDTYNGTQASMACIDLPINSNGVVKDVTVNVGVAHTWIGDLVFKLFSPNNAKTLTMMSRPGAAETLDDGNGPAGDSSDLVKANQLTFRDLGAKDAELMGNTLTGVQAACKDDAACDYKPNPGKGPGLKFSDFVGSPAADTWKFCVGDGGSGDPGTIDAVKLTIDLQ